MYGFGVVKSLFIALKHFLLTYWDDIKFGRKRYNTKEGIAHRSGKDARGIFTIQYPEEKLLIPEEFRYNPFLLYEEGPDGEKIERCTACGICAKVCPPQCIWIVRAMDPATGKPIPSAAEFYIDIDICMNCGSCAEYCPFDAIKMDHEYEMAVYDRKYTLYDKTRLLKPVSYYASIRPKNYELEEIARKEAEAARAAAKATKATPDVK
jgi:NADH-quinone oxidoreductase subunit I